MKTFLCLAVLVVLLATAKSTTVGQARQSNNPSAGTVFVTTDTTYIKTLELDFNFPFQWQAIRGSTNLIIQHSANYEITLTEQQEILTVSVATKANVTKSVKKRSHVRPNMDCSQGDCINLLVPGFLIEQFSQNGETWPVLCNMHHLSYYSSMPSNTALVFEDRHCTVRRPTDWVEWLEYYFGPDSGQGYFGDYDGDGLVNILEYYGPPAFERSFLTIDCDIKRMEIESMVQKSTPTLVELCSAAYNGTDPTEADTDGDLLMDGFEIWYYLNPLGNDDPLADPDEDNVNNLNEQIHGTDPFFRDSDGDGEEDGKEVAMGADPINPADFGQPGAQYADVVLTVGDPSTNQSERFVINVGEVMHQSPTFGDVSSGVYRFGSGSHIITMQHIESNLPVPDYDYTADVVRVSGKAKAIVSDGQGMLGDHFESTYFYAAGKTATLLVENNCTETATDVVCTCGRQTRCVDCKADGNCLWDIKQQTCRAKNVWDSPWNSVTGEQMCPCEACLEWYETETNDTTWLTQVNQELPCPCRVTRDTYNLVPTDQPIGNWVPDIACMVNAIPFCSGFHPGADGCLISVATTSTGARQQCCYGDDGNLLPAGHLGAGTPDKSGEFWAHQEADVKPYEWCCSECRELGYCPLYQEVREGNHVHCNTVKKTVLKDIIKKQHKHRE